MWAAALRCCLVSRHQAARTTDPAMQPASTPSMGHSGRLTANTYSALRRSSMRGWPPVAGVLRICRAASSRWYTTASVITRTS